MSFNNLINISETEFKECNLKHFICMNSLFLCLLAHPPTLIKWEVFIGIKMAAHLLKLGTKW